MAFRFKYCFSIGSFLFFPWRDVPSGYDSPNAEAIETATPTKKGLLVVPCPPELSEIEKEVKRGYV